MDVLLGVVVVALELVPISKRLFNSDIPQGNTGQPRHDTTEQPYCRPSCRGSGEEQVGPQSAFGSRLLFQWALGQTSWHEARVCGLVGLGPCLVQGVRGYGPCYKVEAQGPRA